MLQTASRGVYSAEEVASVPLDLRRAWMEPSGQGALRLDDAARGLVTFRALNLISAWPMSGPFDAVFCRNVVIYFDRPTQEKLVNKFCRQLRRGGYLFMGHSETLNGLDVPLVQVCPTVYRHEP